jgi:nucleotide-binding universal stress UspA family protein
MHVVSSLGFTMAGPDVVSSAYDLASRDLKSLEQRMKASGAVTGVEHEIIVREGEVWEQVEATVRQRKIELIVVGTHSRTGIARLVLGSTAEEIFRHASCPVLTVGPCCPTDVQLNSAESVRPLLFPTDFSEQSLRALPYAASLANEQNTRLVLLHVLAPVPEVHGNRWYTARDVFEMRKDASQQCLERLHDIGVNLGLAIDPMCTAEIGEPAEGIIGAAEDLRVEAIIMGLKRRAHVDTISHMPWSTAYKVVCGASSAVLTVRA